MITMMKERALQARRFSSGFAHAQHPLHAKPWVWRQVLAFLGVANFQTHMHPAGRRQVGQDASDGWQGRFITQQQQTLRLWRSTTTWSQQTDNITRLGPGGKLATSGWVPLGV